MLVPEGVMVIVTVTGDGEAVVVGASVIRFPGIFIKPLVYS
jgi:hypothetical protein